MVFIGTIVRSAEDIPEVRVFRSILCSTDKRQCDAFKRAATVEGIPTYARHAVRDGDRGQSAAITESILPYARHAVRDHKIGHQLAIKIQVMRIVKRVGIIAIKLYPTPCCKICDVDRCQSAATVEGRPPYARHAVRDGDGGQPAATVEGIFPYARPRDDDFFQ